MTTRLWPRCANSGKFLPVFLPSVLSHKTQTRDQRRILSTLRNRVTQTTGIRIVSDAAQKLRDPKTGRDTDHLHSKEGAHSHYGHYDDQASCRSVPAVFCGSHPGMTFPLEKRHCLGRALNELSDGLYGYAMVLSRDRTEAEDLVQETCVRAIQAIENLRPDSNVKGWLFTILRNIWLNRLRRQRGAPKMVELDGDDSAAQTAVAGSKDPHALYVSKVERERVREAIQQLSGEFREVILLREFADLSYQEIASVLGCPAGTVMSRLGRARSKLRSLLSGSSRTPHHRARGATE
jgi:RNA polymerase sigma-70 factor (ECF subfamily)